MRHYRANWFKTGHVWFNVELATGDATGSDGNLYNTFVNMIPEHRTEYGQRKPHHRDPVFSDNCMKCTKVSALTQCAPPTKLGGEDREYRLRITRYVAARQICRVSPTLFWTDATVRVPGAMVISEMEVEMKEIGVGTEEG